MNVLLLNGENVQTICVARSLRQQGHFVVVFANSRFSSGYASKYINKKYVSPDIIKCCSEFEAYLYEYLTKTQIDLIIPMGDDSATFLSQKKEHIESTYKCRCAVPTYSIFNIANDKQLLMELCEKYSLPHPRTRGISMDNIDSVAEYVGFPSMIKPNISAGAKGIVKVDTKEELKLKLPSIIKQFGDSTLQEYVQQSGHYYNVMLYRDRNGLIAAYTIIKILRYFPIKGGSSCYCQTVEHPYLLEKCKEVLECLDWRGFADFDILEDVKSGELKIIEINPRVPSSLQASVAAGVDFAKIIIADEFGEDPDPPFSTYVTGKEIRWFGLDVMWFIFSNQRLIFRPSWFKFFGRNVSYQDGSIKDPMPMMAGCIAGVLKYLNPKFRKSKLGK